MGLILVSNVHPGIGENSCFWHVFKIQQNIKNVYSVLFLKNKGREVLMMFFIPKSQQDRHCKIPMLLAYSSLSNGTYT